MKSSIAKPTIKVFAVDDAQNENDSLVVEHVVHHAMVADAESMERVGGSWDRLRPLAANTASLRDPPGQVQGRLPDPLSEFLRQPLEGARRGLAEADLVWFRRGHPAPQTGRLRDRDEPAAATSRTRSRSRGRRLPLPPPA